MVLGIYFIVISVLIDMDQLVKVGIIFGVIVLYNLAKKKIVEPRIGVFRLSIRRSRLFRTQNIIIACLTLLLVFITILSRLEILVIKPIIITISVSIVVILITALVAMIFSFKRLIIYGIVLSAVILSMNTLVDSIGDPLAELFMLIIPGCLIFIYGVLLFNKFIKNNPKIEGDDYE